MLQKTYSFICDSCGCGIDHYPGYTKAEAIATGKKVGIVFRKGKHFCNKKCERAFDQIQQKGGEK